ncbi:vegetative incompatibility het-e-1 [Trichoderma arundinaceum]|uniref:Vegetative incompatibility het-e-1 n=1 Tax=Trichoderma arundinaceum TaxID=490622 RepID=A0A395NPP9_TRIAR|nr:vegetative incompatibility het-e-1 [Trichoderma arundinaceum]
MPRSPALTRLPDPHIPDYVVEYAEFQAVNRHVQAVMRDLDCRDSQAAALVTEYSSKDIEILHERDNFDPASLWREMSNPDDYTVGWICAITTEYVAARAVLDETHDGPERVSTNDNNDYTLGRIGRHNVVIAILPDGEYGVSSAARVAADMSHSFPSVRIGLMVGIGGGAPTRKHDIRLGDVVVSSPARGIGGVFQYDFGKTIQGQSFQTTGFLNQPPSVLRAAVTGLRAQYEHEGNQLEEAIGAILEKKPRLRKKYRHPSPSSDRLYQSHVCHPVNEESSCAIVCGEDPTDLISRPERTEDEDNPTIHYGLIASANQLMKNALLRDKLAAEQGVMCFEMEAAGLMNHFPCLVIRGICDYADTHKNKDWQGYAAMTAAVYTKDLLKRIAPNRVEAEKKIGSLLTTIDDKMDSVSQKISLAKLPAAGGATYDSHAEEQNPTCLPDTRVELLDQINVWAKGSQSASIFWLNGMAGTGKSTISRTVARNFAATGHLGANFFFKRGEGDRGNASKLFTTVALQLAAIKPVLAPYIKGAIDTDSSIGDKGLQEQFNRLILQPLSAISLNTGEIKSLIIVIDALDECEREDDVKILIHLFSRTKNLGLRVFVTSRPELPIRLGFSAIKGKFQDVILHEISEPVIEHDLGVFLKHKLGTIRETYNNSVEKHRRLDQSWPGQRSIDTIVKMAIPLFIFAATVCRFLADRKCGNPDERLRRSLDYQTRSQESKLDATYLPVLDQQIIGLSIRERDEVLQQFRAIVGSIVLLASPLSTSALSRLLDIPRHTIDNRLDMLHSVLSIPASAESPVRLLHLSFREFLVDPEKEGRNLFWVSEAQTHREISENCFRVLRRFLRPDMCNLRSLGMEGSTPNSDKVNTDIPYEVQYACLHWVFHLESTRNYTVACREALRFLKQHFLHWVEALGLMRQASESIKMIDTLQTFLLKHNNNPLHRFLDDSLRVLQVNFSIIHAAPLQIYSSALIFAPSESIIRNTFASQIPSWISLLPKTDSDWDQCIQKLEGHTDVVKSVALSHDASLVASASQDQTVRIWRTDTGECIHILKGHSYPVHSVAFSHDSKLLASASYDETVQLWDTAVGEHMRTLEGHAYSVNSVDFSHDSSLLASASQDQTIRIWRTSTGECIQTLEGHSDWVRSAVFSHDSSLVASASDDLTVRLWHASTGQCIRALVGHGSSVNSVSFSYDSAHIASASHDQTIRIWDAQTGKCIYELKGHSDPVRSVAFSDNSSYMASASNDQAVRLWNVNTGDCVQVLAGHTGAVNSVAFSDNSSIIASASQDKTVRLWRFEMGRYIQRVKRHSDFVRFMAISHESSLVASVSYNETMIWRSDTGEYLQEFEGHENSARSTVFSSDLSLMASKSEACIEIWRTRTSEFLHELKGHSDPVLALVFSQDSLLIASASYDCTVRIWRVDTGECIQILECSTQAELIAFSHDSSLIASVTDYNVIGIWDSKGRCIQKLNGHAYAIQSVVFSDDLLLVASASKDYTVRLWSIASGNCIHKLEGHTESVMVVAFSHDSSLVASASRDHTVRIWTTDKGQHEANYLPGDKASPKERRSALVRQRGSAFAGQNLELPSGPEADLKPRYFYGAHQLTELCGVHLNGLP